MADANRVTVDLTTGVGVLSFPRVFLSTAGDNKKKPGEKVYDVQFLIPKSDRETARAIIMAVKTVAEAKWGDNWKKVKNPLRDGDKEKDQLTDDGSLKGDKYPERLGHYFINARSNKPIGVVNRKRETIVEPSEIYAGVKAKIHVTFYPYNTEGNQGVGCGLNGVQKISDGESIGSGGKPSVESMFDMLDDDDDLGLDDEADATEEVEAKPAAKKAAKKAPAKKAAAKKAAPEPESEADDDVTDLGDDDVAEDEDDLYEDLDV